MIRLILVLIFMVIFLIISLPFLLMCYIVGLINVKTQRKFTLFFVRIWGRLLVLSGGGKPTVTGRENVPENEAVLFVGNHRGLFDIPVFYGYTPIPAGFVAKKEIDKIPIINLWMRCIGCLFLDRSSLRAGAKTIIRGIEMIKEGDSLFIFPEGTRSKTDGMGHFKPGSLKLSEKSGCPIVPIALIDTDKIYEANGNKLKSSKCGIAFGKPIRHEELTDEERKNLAEYVKARVQELINANKI